MKKELNLQIGERVRYARKTVGFSRDELAEMLGISSLFLSYIECGQRGMSLSTLINLCKFLQVSSDYILFGKNENDYVDDEVINTVKSIDTKYHTVVLNNLNNLKKTIAVTKNILDEENSVK